MDLVGVMPMPKDFRYVEIFKGGRPQHQRLDEFSIRHPSMDASRRAKIFAPFDALKGFSEAVSAKTVRYVERPELNPEEEATLSSRLRILRGLTYNRPMARKNRVLITATYFVPCQDPEHDAYGRLGSLRSFTGICWCVDPEDRHILLIGEREISLLDLVKVEGQIFESSAIEDMSWDWVE